MDYWTGRIATYYWAVTNPESAIGILETVNDILNNSMPPRHIQWSFNKYHLRLIITNKK